MPENDNTNENGSKRFDLTKTQDAEHFKDSVRRYVIRRTITGLSVRKDRVEIHMDSGQMITCMVEGPDICIHVPSSPSVTTLAGTPGVWLM